MSARRRTRETRVVLLAMVVVLGALYPLQVRIDAASGPVQREKDELVFRSGALLKKLSLGYDSLLADIYWTRAVQYYGGKLAARDSNLELLAPLLDLTTTLDPQLLVAYKFGGIFLAEPSPVGLGRPDLAVDLVHRGIAANPDEWSLWANLGFIYYWYARDYSKASEAYLEGSKHPQAQEWMKGMAAKITEEGGSRETSRFLWAQIYDSSQDPKLRKNALAHLQSLKAEEDAEHLEQLTAEFNRRFGHFPESFRELIAAGMLRGVPVDPAGYPYVLGPGGKIRLSPASPVRSEILKPVIPR